METDINTDTIWRRVSIRIQFGDRYQYGYNMETDINTDTIWRQISIRIQYGDGYQYGHSVETGITSVDMGRATYRHVNMHTCSTGRTTGAER